MENKKHRLRKKDELKTKIGIEHDLFDEMCERVTCEVDGDICVFWDRKIETDTCEDVPTRAFDRAIFYEGTDFRG